MHNRSSPDPDSIAPSTKARMRSTKARMRWTQELREAFVEAVNQLGGRERATPEGILDLMKVEGLTIEHVKSQLHSMGITEELQRLMGLQKQLHEQLETQRKLQLQIEEQGKYLEKMYGQQRKTDDNRVKPTSSTSDEHNKLGWNEWNGWNS